MVNFTVPPPAPSPDPTGLTDIYTSLLANSKQQDPQGFFIAYLTTSTKKPYVWEKLDFFGSISPEQWESSFSAIKKSMQAYYKESDKNYQGMRIVSFSVDPLNVNLGMTILKTYCYEEYTPKKKVYINGPKAEKNFLATKGKHFVTKASV